MALEGASGKTYVPEAKPLASGGEGTIFEIVGANNTLAKIYHDHVLSKALEEKLKYMTQFPPAGSIAGMIAWPQDVLYERGKFVGFVMDKLDVGQELSMLYRYSPGKQSATTSQKVIIAQNICAVISEVHKAGFVFGDFNPANVGVNTQNGTVVFLDTDTYHIYNTTTGDTYRCNACLDGYVAPEVLTACGSGGSYASVPLPTFTKESDLFALAIHIFKLLMNGVNPYCGLDQGARVSQAAPSIGNDPVRRDEYCYKPGKKPTTKVLPDRSALSDEIFALFERAFIDGRKDPKQRPDADEWYQALEDYRKTLQPCAANPTHEYRNVLPACPLCEADKQFMNAFNNSPGGKPGANPGGKPGTAHGGGAPAGGMPLPQIPTGPLPPPPVGVPPVGGTQGSIFPPQGPQIPVTGYGGIRPNPGPTGGFAGGFPRRPIFSVNARATIGNILCGLLAGFALATLMMMFCGAAEYQMSVSEQWLFVNELWWKFPNGVWARCGRYALLVFFGLLAPILIGCGISLRKKQAGLRRQNTNPNNPMYAVALRAVFPGLGFGAGAFFAARIILSLLADSVVSAGVAQLISIACFAAIFVLIQILANRNNRACPLSQQESVESIQDSLTSLFCIGFCFFASWIAVLPSLAADGGSDKGWILCLFWAASITVGVGLIVGKIENVKARILTSMVLSFLLVLLFGWFQTTPVFGIITEAVRSLVF